MTIDDLEEQIMRVDAHHAKVIAKIDEVYGQKTDELMEKIQFLQVQMSELSMRLQSLERKR